MRRADFKAIAETIRQYNLAHQDQDIRELIERLCVQFRISNATFDKGKFIKACGWYQE